MRSEEAGGGGVKLGQKDRPIDRSLVHQEIK